MKKRSNRAKHPVMPFGKYRGTPIHKLDREYVRWLSDNVPLREPLFTQLQQCFFEFEFQYAEKQQSARDWTMRGLQVVLGKDFEAMRQGLTEKYCFSVEAIAAINEIFDELQSDFPLDRDRF